MSRLILRPAQGWIAVFLLIAMFPAVAAERIVLAHIYEESTGQHREALWAAKEIEKRSNGRFQVGVVPKGQMGASDPLLMEQFKTGKVDVTYLGVGHAGSLSPTMALPAAPFLMRDFEHWKLFRSSALFDELKADFEKVSQTRVLGLVYYGQRHISAKKALTGLDDIKDLIIRVPNQPVILKTFRALGARPVALPFGETRQALADGIVEAQENPLPTILAMKFHEVSKIITLSGHSFDSQLLVMREARWEALGDADKKLFAEVFAEAASRITEATRAAELELVERFKGMGVTVNTIDRAPLAAAVEGMLTADDATWGKANVERMRALR